MRNVLIPALVFASLFGAGAQAQEAAAPVAQCIRDNAAKVEQAIPALNTAVDFLVNDVCVVQVAEEQQKQRTAVLRASFERQKKKCDAKKAAGQSTAIKSEGTSYDPCEMYDGEESSLYSSYASTLSTYTRADPASIALAAQTLLDVRLSRSARGHKN